MAEKLFLHPVLSTLWFLSCSFAPWVLHAGQLEVANREPPLISGDDGAKPQQKQLEPYGHGMTQKKQDNLRIAWVKSVVIYCHYIGLSSMTRKIGNYNSHSNCPHCFEAWAQVLPERLRSKVLQSQLLAWEKGEPCELMMVTKSAPWSFVLMTNPRHNFPLSTLFVKIWQCSDCRFTTYLPLVMPVSLPRCWEIQQSMTWVSC